MSEENAESLLPKNLMQVGDKMVVRLKYTIPSLNKLFALNHWGRAKERKVAAAALESAFSQGEAAFSIQTTSPASVSLIISAMRESLSKTMRTRLSIASLRRKSRKAAKKLSSR